MYNKRYKLESIETTRHNSIHDEILGKICYLAYFKEGERGWFLCNTEDGTPCPVHRIHTSEVKEVSYSGTGMHILVSTENTKYYFIDTEYLDALQKLVQHSPDVKVDYNAIIFGKQTTLLTEKEGTLDAEKTT